LTSIDPTNTALEGLRPLPVGDSRTHPLRGGARFSKERDLRTERALGAPGTRAARRAFPLGTGRPCSPVFVNVCGQAALSPSCSSTRGGSDATAVFGRDAEGVRPLRHCGPAADVGNRRTTGACAENAHLPTRRKAARGPGISPLPARSQQCQGVTARPAPGSRQHGLVTWSGLSLIIGNTLETKRPSCDLSNAWHEPLRRETRNGRAPVGPA